MMIEPFLHIIPDIIMTVDGTLCILMLYELASA